MRVLLKYLRCGATAGVLLIHYWFWRFRKYCKHADKYPLEFRWVKIRQAAIHIIAQFHSDIDFQHVERLKEAMADPRGCILVGNHLSIFDMLTLMAVCEKPVTFIAKKELLKTPLLGKATRSIDALFLDRDDPRQAIKVMQISSEQARNGGFIGVFPEGTRNKDPENTPVADFHPGSLKVALRGEANILCFAEYGTFRYLAGPTNFKSNLIQFNFLPLIRYEEIKDKNTKELADITYKLINDEVTRMKEVDKQYIAEGRHKKKHAKWWKENPYVASAFKEDEK